MSKLTQRDAFFSAIYKIANLNKDVVIVAADMSAPALDKFRRDFPSRFVNVGIAEQNAILVASGLALIGKKVFAYAIAPFITLRCLEQIRVENAIMKIPITIVGMGVGLGYENDGPTHHLIEDIAILRSMPHIRIHSLTDNIMAEAYASLSCDMSYPNYIRLEKDFTSDVYPKGFDFLKGLAKLREGDYLLLSTGIMTHAALKIADSMKIGAYRKIGVIDIFELPINESELIDVLSKAKKIVTIEEHFLAGGLGSAVAEIMVDRGLKIPLRRIGIPFHNGYCYQYGGREAIRERYGIDKQSLSRIVKGFFTD